MTTWPAKRAGERGVLAGREKRQGEHGAGPGDAEQRRQQLVGILDFGDVAVAMCVERGRRDDREWQR